MCCWPDWSRASIDLRIDITCRLPLLLDVTNVDKRRRNWIVEVLFVYVQAHRVLRLAEQSGQLLHLYCSDRHTARVTYAVPVS